MTSWISPRSAWLKLLINTLLTLNPVSILILNILLIFLVVAAKLLLLKSRALLPYLYPSEDEEVDDFESQIKMYKEFLDATKLISQLIGQPKKHVGREFSKQSLLLDSFTPPKTLMLGDLPNICYEVYARLKPVEELGVGTIIEHINIDDR
jgi:hypothetical protein